MSKPLAGIDGEMPTPLRFEFFSQLILLRAGDSLRSNKHHRDGIRTMCGNCFGVLAQFFLPGFLQAKLKGDDRMTIGSASPASELCIPSVVLAPTNWNNVVVTLSSKQIDA